MNKEKLKKFWNKFWFIVWKDESPRGWIISILFIFIMIKYVFFPLLSLATGTVIPLAIVESCSMYHQGNIFSDQDSWWERHEGRYSQLGINSFSDFPFKKGFTKGDILFIVKRNPDKLKMGNIIIFDINQRNPVIHRIIEINQNDDGTRTFSTIGDNNQGQLSFERSISESQLMGKAVFRLVPSFGWVKLIFYENFRPENERGFCNER